jgi:hypothetical protein
MRRREFIGLVGGAATWPLAARAQQLAKMKRLAIIHPTTKAEDLSIGGDPDYSIILEDIKRLGYVEGVNLTVDRYSAEGRPERRRHTTRCHLCTCGPHRSRASGRNSHNSNRRLDRRSGRLWDRIEHRATRRQRHWGKRYGGSRIWRQGPAAFRRRCR